MSVATALVLVALAALPLLYARDSAYERRRRAGWFGSALPLFDSYRLTQEGKSWPVLTGRYRGREMRLEPVLDDMAWRKVPSLWLKVTLLSANPARNTMGFLARPRGGEFYSPTQDMLHRHAVPEGWPADGLFCTDQAQALPYLDELTPEMSAFSDPRMKELVVTPRGVRLVHQAAQAERSHYLVLRQAHFARTQADAVQVQALLEQVLTIADRIDARCQPAKERIAA